MPYRRRHFEKGKPFHVVSRAVQEARIFEKEDDRYRFIFQLQAANLGRPAPNTARHNIKRAVNGLLEGHKLSSLFLKNRHTPFVQILDFALVGNHYHLFLIPNVENGVPPFMRRLNLGFAKYFNLKHERKGTLFASRYKIRLIKGQTHSDAIRRYVSIINPLDIFQPEWRAKGIDKPEEAFDFLEKYRFSSFPDNARKREAGILASEKTRQQYGLPSGTNFLDFAEHFLKEKSSRPYSLTYLE